MADLAKWKIALNRRDSECAIECDGVRLDNVVGISVSKTAGNLPLVSVTFHAASVEVEGEALAPEPSTGVPR